MKLENPEKIIFDANLKKENQMKLENSTILLIGGAGFIGSHIVRELLKEPISKLIIYDNFTRGKYENLKDCLTDDRCTIYPNGGDIRDVEILNHALQGVDYVIHLAALWLLHCKEFPRTAFHVNIEGTFNVLEACVNNKVKKLIFSSSASVYGDAAESPMEETHPFNNKNFYGATKIAGEAMCVAYNDRYGLEIIGLRYMNVYGPGQNQRAAYTGFIPNILNKIYANETPVINGDGSQAYDFVYVEDVARCNVDALKSDIKFGFYNVATEVQTTVKEVCDTIIRLTNSNVDVIFKPFDELDSSQFVQNRIGSKKKAKIELNFEATHSIEDGLRKLIEWRKTK